MLYRSNVWSSDKIRMAELERLKLERLKEIQKEMLELLDEAEFLVRTSGNRMAYDRAKSYWIPHIKTALTKESEYLGHSITMEDTISEIGNHDDSNNDHDSDKEST